MLWPRSLRAWERPAWLEAVTTDCPQRQRITVTDRSWQVVGSPVTKLEALQTTIDTSQDTDRRLDVTAVDVGGRLEESGLLLWHVVVEHHVEALGRWVPSPLGVYVPNRVVRQGREVEATLPDLEAQWAVSLPRNMFGPIGKGVPVYTAAKDLLRALGVRRFRFPGTPLRERAGKGRTRLVRTARRWEYGGPDEADRPVQVVRRMLLAHGVQFYFDGQGYAVARPLSQRPVYDVDDWLLAGDPPEETTDWLTARNRWVVTSGSGKKVMHGRAEAPDWHRASAKKRAVFGVDIPHTGYSESESRSQRVLNQTARARLSEQLADHRSVTARMIALPFDPEDFTRVTGPSGPIASPLRQASTDWLGDGGMTVGQARRLTPVRPRRRK